MFGLGGGPVRVTRALEPDRPDLTDDDLQRVCEFNEFLNRRMGGHASILSFLNACEPRWPPNRAISILDANCERGDLSRAIVRWARGRRRDVRVLAVSPSKRIIEMATGHRPSIPEIAYDCRSYRDPSFLQAQQFDYVVSLSLLNQYSLEEAGSVLKKFEMLSKRGLVIADWLRTIGAACVLGGVARIWGEETARREIVETIRQGFAMGEVRKLTKNASTDFVTVRRRFGLRFTVSGERRLVFSPEYAPAAGLAGAGG